MNSEIEKIKEAINVSTSVATELYLLSNDADMAIEMSKMSNGLDQCKARVINERFKRIEGEVDYE